MAENKYGFDLDKALRAAIDRGQFAVSHDLGGACDTLVLHERQCVDGSIYTTYLDEMRKTIESGRVHIGAPAQDFAAEMRRYDYATIEARMLAHRAEQRAAAAHRDEIDLDIAYGDHRPRAFNIRDENSQYPATLTGRVSSECFLDSNPQAENWLRGMYWRWDWGFPVAHPNMAVLAETTEPAIIPEPERPRVDKFGLKVREDLPMVVAWVPDEVARARRQHSPWARFPTPPRRDKDGLKFATTYKAPELRRAIASTAVASMPSPLGAR